MGSDSPPPHASTELRALGFPDSASGEEHYTICLNGKITCWCNKRGVRMMCVGVLQSSSVCPCIPSFIVVVVVLVHLAHTHTTHTHTTLEQMHITHTHHTFTHKHVHPNTHPPHTHILPPQKNTTHSDTDMSNHACAHTHTHTHSPKPVSYTHLTLPTNHRV